MQTQTPSSDARSVATATVFLPTALGLPLQGVAAVAAAIQAQLPPQASLLRWAIVACGEELLTVEATCGLA